MCYAKTYRGPLGLWDDEERERGQRKPKKSFSIPEIDIKALDPFDTDL